MSTPFFKFFSKFFDLLKMHIKYIQFQHFCNSFTYNQGKIPDYMYSTEKDASPVSSNSITI